MALMQILTEPNKILRQKSLAVEKVDDDLRILMDSMLETMYAAPGIGLAAIQVGVPKRVIVLDIASKEAPRNPMCFVNPEIIKKSDSLSNPPCITKTDILIPTSVSNWGGYGLVAGLSKLSGEKLLPSSQEDEKLIKNFVDAGAVDGITASQVYKVDSFDLDVNNSIINRLHQVI